MKKYFNLQKLIGGSRATIGTPSLVRSKSSRLLILLPVLAAIGLIILVLRIEAYLAITIVLLLSIHTAMVDSMQINAAKRDRLSMQFFMANVSIRHSEWERRLGEIAAKLDLLVAIAERRPDV